MDPSKTVVKTKAMMKCSKVEKKRKVKEKVLRILLAKIDHNLGQKWLWKLLLRRTQKVKSQRGNLIGNLWNKTGLVWVLKVTEEKLSLEWSGLQPIIRLATSFIIIIYIRGKYWMEWWLWKIPGSCGSNVKTYECLFTTQCFHENINKEFIDRDYIMKANFDVFSKGCMLICKSNSGKENLRIWFFPHKRELKLEWN